MEIAKTGNINRLRRLTATLTAGSAGRLSCIRLISRDAIGRLIFAKRQSRGYYKHTTFIIEFGKPRLILCNSRPGVSDLRFYACHLGEGCNESWQFGGSTRKNECRNSLIGKFVLK